MIGAVIFLGVVSLSAMVANCWLINVANKLDATNEDLMEENMELRENMRAIIGIERDIKIYTGEFEK